MRRRGTSGIAVIAGIGLIAIVLAILWPLFAQSHEGHRSYCLSNLKQISTGMLIYSADEDDRFPDRDRWVELTYPYVKNEPLYHCPEVKPLKRDIYGYAYNGWLNLRNGAALKNPGDVPMLYDSINFAKSASDPVLSFPQLPPAGSKEKPRRNMGFVDGHVKYQGPAWAGWRP